MHDPQKDQDWKSDLHNELGSEIKLFKLTGVKKEHSTLYLIFLTSQIKLCIENSQNQKGWKGKLNALDRDKIRKGTFNN